MTVANTAITVAQHGAAGFADRRGSAQPVLSQNSKGESAGVASPIFSPDSERLDKSSNHIDLNLFFFNSGSTPPNPTEFIGSKRMNETLAALRDHYDYILIDSPPVMPVSDAVVVVHNGGRGRLSGGRRRNHETHGQAGGLAARQWLGRKSWGSCSIEWISVARSTRIITSITAPTIYSSSAARVT